MADSVVKVKFLGDATSLKTAAREADSALGATEKAAKGIKGAFSQSVSVGAGIGAGVVGVEAAVSAFKSLAVTVLDASKAAEADARSQFTLASAIKNNTDAAYEGTRGAEDYIASLSKQVAIADDELRPALATLVRSTHDVSDAQKLLSLSADVAAGTGENLGTVADAVAKAYQGNTRQLKALAPEMTKLIKDGASAGEVFNALQTAYAGNAEGLADVSPWQRLTVQFGEVQEALGVGLLPVLTDVADLATELAPAVAAAGEAASLAGEAFSEAAKGVGDAVQAASDFIALGPGFSDLGGKLKDVFTPGRGHVLADMLENGVVPAAKMAELGFDGMGASATESGDDLNYTTAAAKSTAATLRDLKSATFDLPNAQRKVSDGWESIDDAAKSSGGTMRDVERDMRSIRNAAESLTDAQDELAKAEQRVADVRKGATPRSRLEAAMELEESKINNRQAQLRVTAAETDLVKIRKDGTATADEITAAELNLQQSRLDLEKSYITITDAQDELNTLLQSGKDGSEDLKAAQEQLADAQRQVRDATESVADAQKAATEQGGAHKDTTKAIADAYETQKKNIWDTVDAMIAQGKTQQEIDAFIEESGVKLDDYAKKYRLAKEDVDAFKNALSLLAILSNPTRTSNAFGGNYVPPADLAQGAYNNAAGMASGANAAESRVLRARVAVPLIVNGKELAQALIEVDQGYN